MGSTATGWAGFVSMLAVAGVVLTGCFDFDGSPDAPGYDGCCEDEDDDYDAGAFSRLYRWSITDLDTGDELSHGCPSSGIAEVTAGPGQRLTYELWAERQPRDEEVPPDNVIWCGFLSPLARWVVPIDIDPNDYSPGASSAVRVIAWDVNAEAPPPDWPEELPAFVPGKGLRIFFEVLQPGRFELESTGFYDVFATHPDTIEILEQGE